MKTSWKRFFRRVASILFVGGATAYSSAMCYAVQLAFDSAVDPVYADGWQGTDNEPVDLTGDNGGFGFTQWAFDNDTIFEDDPIGVYEMDGPPSQSAYNQVGTAWRFGISFFENPTNPNSKDIARAGRGLATPLQVGQTLSIVSDPPSDTAFFDILRIRLITGGGNICYGNAACTSGTDPTLRFDFGFFNYGDADNFGRWSATSIGPTTLFTTDKGPGEHPSFPTGAAGTDSGFKLDFKLTGAETFQITATPLDEPSRAFTGSGTLLNPGAGPIDWIEFTHWGSESIDGLPTDWYIRSLEVSSEAPAADADFDNDGDVDGADFLRWQRGVGTAGATNAQGNADGDSDVDGADLAIWKQKFNAPAVSVIPEPASAASALLAGGALGARAAASRKRRRT